MKFLSNIYAWFISNIPAQSALLAMVMTMLRIHWLQENKTLKTKVIECLMMGLLSLTAGNAIKWLGIPLDATLFIVGVFCVIGLDTTRGAAKRFLNAQASK